MTRFVLIDNPTGYIWGDSASFEGGVFETEDAVAFARALDESLGDTDLTYEMVRRNSNTEELGYHVYEIDKPVPVTTDGRDEEQIDAVVRDGEYRGFIRIVRKPD